MYLISNNIYINKFNTKWKVLGRSSEVHIKGEDSGKVL